MQLSFALRQHGMFRRTSCMNMSAKTDGHTAKSPRNVVDLPTSSRERRRSVMQSIRALTAAPKQKTINEIQTRYDPTHHCMLAAMRCAVSNRPFISVEDEFYKLELEHLRAGESPKFYFMLQRACACVNVNANTYQGTVALSRKQTSRLLKPLHAAAFKPGLYADRFYVVVYSSCHSFLFQKAAVTDLHCGTDEWSGKFATGWKAITATILEDNKDIPTEFVLDYVW